MTPREVEEYRALRATIRERGTTRVWVALAGLAVWAALALITAALALFPAATLVPLLVLAASFEAVFALHTGVERVGRYLQVFYETDGDGWEHQAMAFGAAFRPGGNDPLFAVQFWLATATNVFLAATYGPQPVEWLALALFHGTFAARVGVAGRHARRQRALDLARFRQLKENSGRREVPR
jgi:hypothetical protein